MTLSSVAKANPAAILLPMVAAFCAVQVGAAQPAPVSQIRVRGLTDSAGARVILINAQHDPKTENCQKSVVLPLAGGEASIDDYSSTLGPSKKKTFTFDIATHVARGCWCKDDKAGIAVLAPGKAIAYIANIQRGSLPLRLCIPSQAGLTVDMRPRREVMVQVWAARQNDIPSMAKDDIANAEWIYNNALAGITLRPVFREVRPEDLKTALPECFPKPNETKCCAALADSDFFEPGSLNVYYGLGTGNFSCRKGAPAASFVHDVPVLGDAAHEMSHILGLFQDDAVDNHSAGHTSGDKEKFGCENVMWDGTHFLKDELTPGQAFWISLSTLSFVGKAGANLNCAEDADSKSPCPLFSLGHDDSYESSCKLKEFEKKDLVVLEHREKDLVSCDLPLSTYENGRQLEDALRVRYDQLKRHVRGREDLQLGAITKGEFLDHWLTNFAWNLTDLVSLDASNKTPRELQKQKDRILTTAVPGRYRRAINLDDKIEAARKKASNGCQLVPPKP
jgi:hypothetical protein